MCSHSPATFCPKLKPVFGVSVGSAGVPNVKDGLGSSLGGSGLLKEKAGAGLSASLDALNMNPVAGIEVFFFSSGLPNVKVEFTKAGSLAAGSANGAAGVGSAAGGLPNTGATVLATAVEPAETASVEEGATSFSDLGVEKLNAELDPVFSSGLDGAKEKPPVALVVEELADPVTALFPPNLKPVLEFGDSLFFSSLFEAETVPNLKPSEEEPNLKPPEELVPVEDSVEVPNLKPPEASEDEPGNLKSADFEVESEVALPT